MSIIEFSSRWSVPLSWQVHLSHFFANFDYVSSVVLTVVDKQKVLDLSKTISTILKNNFVCRVLHAFVCRHFLFNMLTDKLDIHTNSRMNRNMKKKIWKYACENVFVTAIYTVGWSQLILTFKGNQKYC